MKKKTPVQFIFLGGEAAVFAFSGAVMFILISRVSGSELLGQYSLVFAWIMVFQAVGNFGIPEFLMREFGRFQQEESKYFSNGLILGLVSSVAAIGLMIGAVYLSGYDSEIKQALTLGTVILVPFMVNMICRGGFIAHKKTDLIFKVALLECTLVLSVNVYLVLNGYGIVPLIQTLVAGKLISSLASLYLFSQYAVPWSWELDIQFCKKLLPSIFIFAVSNVLGLISMRANVIMLSWWGNLSMVGLYAAASKLIEFTFMLPSIFGQYLMPHIARTFKETSNYELKQFENSFYFLFATGIASGLGLILFADKVIYLLFGSTFEASVIVFRILLVLFLVECLDTMLGMVLKAADKQKQDVFLYASHPALNIIMNFILIPSLGGIGAALARLAGALTSCTLRYMYIARHIVRFSWFSLIIKPFFICASLVGCTFLLRGQAPYPVLGIFYLASSTLLLYWTHQISAGFWSRILSRDK
jgi:O-antigen/teichoic acid export membrane protein